MLKRLKQQGITILVSTPYMDEASLCDRIALIQQGRFLKIDTPEAITAQFTDLLWAVQETKCQNCLATCAIFHGSNPVMLLEIRTM
jgi:ABC-type multidrug transport system ATPase subunit